MPAASTLPARAARPRKGSGGNRAPRTARRTGGAQRVRWDRVGRLALLCVLVALVYLYVSAGFRMLSTWRQSSHDKAAVAAMEREHHQLASQHEALSGQGALEAQARKLG